MKNYFKTLLSGFFCGINFFPYGSEIRKERFNITSKINNGQEQDERSLKGDVVQIKTYFDRSFSKIR